MMRELEKTLTLTMLATRYHSPILARKSNLDMTSEIIEMSFEQQRMSETLPRNHEQVTVEEKKVLCKSTDALECHTTCTKKSKKNILFSLLSNEQSTLRSKLYELVCILYSFVAFN